MLKLFNTLGRKKETFKPLKGGRAGLYTCGPTVYNYAHIGNLRTYIFEDILRRVLEQGRYKVKHVMNITDIDDKIIRDSVEAKKTIYEFTAPYEKAFFEDLRLLNIKRAWKYPKATSHIKEMVGIIKVLISKKIAYIADDGVYFKISKFKKYGKLSGIPHPLASLKLRRSGPTPLSLLRRGGGEERNLSSEGVRSNMRSKIFSDEYDKSNAADFALWKFKKPGEPFWKAPFGEGRPGWHIECSAMSTKYLGSSFDIHTGGVDNIFPHHENEIAQSEGAFGKKFVKYWTHGEHLLVDGQKMSKSLGNIFTLRDLSAKKINPLAFRYFVLGAHYRSKLNFTREALEAAERALEKLYGFVRSLNSSPQPPSSYSKRRGARGVALFPLRSKFFSAISDDLNTPKALAVIWELVHNYNKNQEKYNSKEVLKTLYEFDEIFGLGLKNLKHFPIPLSIIKLANEREKFREEKNWAEADKIREELRKKGFEIDDTPTGPKISPVSAHFP